MQNCRSLAKCLLKFKSFVYVSNFQIIGLSETWLSNDILDTEILPTEYIIYRKDRGSRGGGVLLAIKNCLPSCELQSPPNLELITLSIYLNRTITCCMVYMPPNATTEYHAELVNYLATITSSSSPVLIFGNYNMPDVNWSTLTGSMATSNRFCDMVFNSNLVQLISSPTYNCGNILDLVLTDNAENIVDLTVHPPEYQCTPSDHYLITFEICFEHTITQSTVKVVFDFAKGDFDGLNRYLLSCNFSSLYTCTNVEEIWGLLKYYIITGMNLFIPTVRLQA